MSGPDGGGAAPKRPRNECSVEISDLSGATLFLRAGMQTTVGTMKKALASQWGVPMSCQKLMFLEPSGASRELSEYQVITELQKQAGTEKYQMTLIGCTD